MENRGSGRVDLGTNWSRLRGSVSAPRDCCSAPKFEKNRSGLRGICAISETLVPFSRSRDLNGYLKNRFFCPNGRKCSGFAVPRLSLRCPRPPLVVLWLPPEIFRPRPPLPRSIPRDRASGLRASMSTYRTYASALPHFPAAAYRPGSQRTARSVWAPRFHASLPHLHVYPPDSRGCLPRVSAPAAVHPTSEFQEPRGLSGVC